MGYDSPFCCEKWPVREDEFSNLYSSGLIRRETFTSIHMHVFMLQFFIADKYNLIIHHKQTVPLKL
jgi:hypothetical protein